MSRRRSNAPRQGRNSGPGGNFPGSGGAGSPRRGFLERLRVQDREEHAQARSRAERAVAGQDRSEKSRSRRGGRTPITKFQVASIIIMVTLGLAVVGSTFIPYIGGLGGGGGFPG
jgi:hypothetical protein